MNELSFSRTVASLAAFAVGLSIFGGCSSDDEKAQGESDSGLDSGAGTGGKKTGTGGRTGSGGGVGAGGVLASACAIAVGTPCDGKEDCPSGQHCCGKYETGYTQFGCFDSCTALAGDAGAAGPGAVLWFELCNPGDPCEDSTAQCLTSSYLPGSLSRCLPASLMGMATGNPPDATLEHDKNAINCGKSVCGSSEQCCLRQPLEPYCAPKGATCECVAPEGGTTPGTEGDASTDASSDASVEPITDASPDSPG